MKYLTAEEINDLIAKAEKNGTIAKPKLTAKKTAPIPTALQKRIEKLEKNGNDVVANALKRFREQDGLSQVKFIMPDKKAKKTAKALTAELKQIAQEAEPKKPSKSRKPVLKTQKAQIDEQKTKDEPKIKIDEENALMAKWEKEERAEQEAKRKKKLKKRRRREEDEILNLGLACLQRNKATLTL